MKFCILIIYTSLWTWAFLVLKIAGSVNSSSAYQQSEVPSLSPKYGVEQFTQTFYLDEWTDWGYYARFIMSLRYQEQLRSGFVFEKIPVLQPEEARPTKFFDVILKVNRNILTSSEITLRIRQDNLYLVGYKNATNQWLEFNDFSRNLIDGSTFLGFRGNYDSLAKRAGSRIGIKLGREQLKQAVFDLATSTNTKTRAKGLTIVIQMISESMRFTSISKFLINESGKPPTTRVVQQENSWGRISEELLRSNADHSHTFVPPDRRTGITNQSEAIEAIGMIKYFNLSRISGWNMEANNEGEYPQAYPMVEVA